MIDNHVNEVHNLCLMLFNSDIFMELLQKDVSMLQEIAALASLREHKNFNDFVHNHTRNQDVHTLMQSSNTEART